MVQHEGAGKKALVTGGSGVNSSGFMNDVSASVRAPWVNPPRTAGNHKVIIRRPGGLEQIGLATEPEPVAAKGEVKIRVLAAGAAYADVLARQGMPGFKFPLTPGFDVVGVVDALGVGTSGFKVGDSVAALTGTDGQQKFICLAETELVLVPPGVELAKAVCVILNYLTAYQLLTRSAGLKKGDTAFIYGLAGGVGTAMQQIAKQLGITLYGTASGARVEMAQRDGAIAFDRADWNWVAAFRARLPGGVDAVFDPVGGSSLNRSYKLLAPKGTLVMLGAASAVQGGGNAKSKILGTLLRFMMLKFRLGSRSVKMYLVEKAKKDQPNAFRDDLATLLGWLAQGTIDPVIDKILPLSEVRQAQEQLERSHVVGKIVLLP